MSIGATVRRAFGPAEPLVSQMYRSAFTDVRAVAATVAAWARPISVLEIGCGEGQLTEELARAIPDSSLTGIDVTPRAGRLYRGPRERAVFLQRTVEAFRAECPAPFDLVVIADVLHHVPWPMHDALLRDAAALVVPGGRLVVKDWERRSNLVHLFCWASDRFVTGDRVRYASLDELRAIVLRALPGAAIERETRLPPWPNNVALLVRP